MREKTKIVLKPLGGETASFGLQLSGAFGASLLIVVIIGLLGIYHVNFLFSKVTILSRHYLPMQAAALESKVSSSFYAMAIRNHAFWKSARYLEGARAAADINAIEKAVAEFDSQIESYRRHLDTMQSESAAPVLWINQQKQWLRDIVSHKKDLQLLGTRVISLVDEQAPVSSINMAIMAFESQLYKLDDFISDTIQKDILISAQKQLSATREARKQALVFLWAALFLGVLIGARTAFLVYRSLKQEFERRQNMVFEMIKIEEKERQHLSAQVHDQMSQDLGALRIYLDLAHQQLPGDCSRASEKISQCKKIISGLIEKAHNIALLLRPPVLDEVGLADSLEALVVDYNRLSKAKCTYRKPKKSPDLPPEYSLYLYRFTQEVLTNAAKYAHAKKVVLCLESSAKKVKLVYEDDGRGFNCTQFIKEPAPAMSERLKLGLSGLKERAELLGGSMAIKSSPNKGTQIQVSLNI